jgi:hypothetical protein
MPKLIVILGPPAVGKMSVGKALCDLKGYRLFYNHMTIDPILPFFEFGSPPFKRLLKNFRIQILEEIANSDLPGVVFTVVWDFDSEGDNRNIRSYIKTFEDRGAPVYFAELKAPLSERLVRNRHPDRLAVKPTKRDVEKSEKHLLHDEEECRMNSNGDFPFPDRHVCIDNTNLPPVETAKEIIRFFNL